MSPARPGSPPSWPWPARLAGGREAVGEVAEALVVHTLELDREIGRAAVRHRREAVRLAAGGAANLDEGHELQVELRVPTTTP